MPMPYRNMESRKARNRWIQQVRRVALDGLRRRHLEEFNELHEAAKQTVPFRP